MLRFITITLLLFFVGIGWFYSSLFVFPSTFLASNEVSGKSKTEVKKLLQKWLNAPIEMQIKDRVYTTSYHELGVVIDAPATINDLYEPNNKMFPQNLFAFSQSLQSQTIKLPNLHFSQDFYNYIDSSVYDFTRGTDQVVVDNKNKQLVYQENEEKYKIDSANLKELLTYNLGKDHIKITPNLVALNTQVKDTVMDYNAKLKAVFQQPITIVIDYDKNSSNVIMQPSDIKKIVLIDYKKDTNQVAIDIDQTEFVNFFNQYLKMNSADNEKTVYLKTFKDDLISLINSRARGTPSDTLVFNPDLHPNTDGSLAQKYIEVDISQQRMYLFQNGDVIASYKVSTGRYYPTPPGKYKILNKAVNAFSDIYNVWMPYWMAFYYDPNVNAYLGIHQVPYVNSDSSTKVIRDKGFMKEPNTGGCVALDVAQSKEVYAFADIGTPIDIFN